MFKKYQTQPENILLFLCMLQIKMMHLLLFQILLRKESCNFSDQEEFLLTLVLLKIIMIFFEVTEFLALILVI